MNASIVERRNRDRLTRASPPVVNGMCPCRSESFPLRGPRAIVVMSRGMKMSPVLSGLRSRTSCRYKLIRRRTAPNAIALRSWAMTPPMNSRMWRSLRSSSG